MRSTYEALKGAGVRELLMKREILVTTENGTVEE
jgi:hypothetical protein